MGSSESKIATPLLPSPAARLSTTHEDYVHVFDEKDDIGDDFPGSQSVPVAATKDWAEQLLSDPKACILCSICCSISLDSEPPSFVDLIIQFRKGLSQHSFDFDTRPAAFQSKDSVRRCPCHQPAEVRTMLAFRRYQCLPHRYNAEI